MITEVTQLVPLFVAWSRFIVKAVIPSLCVYNLVYVDTSYLFNNFSEIHDFSLNYQVDGLVFSCLLCRYYF